MTDHGVGDRPETTPVLGVVFSRGWRDLNDAG